MKLSVMQENLARGLSIVSRAVSSRSTLPVLANVLLKTEDAGLKLTATNLEIGITYWVPGKVDEDGATTVPARLLTDLVNSLPAGDKVEFGTEASIRLRGSAKTFRIVGDDEADPAAGLLSFNAPLARAMLGAEPGDVLPFAGEDDAIEVLGVTVVG